MLSRIPLEAFRVFEAAARHCNFSAAARELGVTQAAVSRRIQTLEDHLGTRLFERRGRHVRLTEAGTRLFHRTRAALDYLSDAVAPAGPGPSPPVTIVASGSISHLWLGPQLRRFARTRPDVAVRLLTSDAMGDLTDPRHDLAVLYSLGHHPDWDLVPLLPERLAPVAAPAYLAERGLDPALATPSEIAALDLVDYAAFNAHWTTLCDWGRSAGLRPGAIRPQVTVSTYLMAVEAAIRGDGVALGSLALLEAPLSDGRLVRLTGHVLETGFAYHLGLPRGRPPGPGTRALHAMLVNAGDPSLRISGGALAGSGSSD